MKILYTLLLVIGTFIGMYSCSVKDELSIDPRENYDALWKILDERYAYFDLKLPKGTTWRDMYHKYLPEIKPVMTSDELYRVLTRLMSELRDGHVNLFTSFDYGRYWGWHEDYPQNYDAQLLAKYLGKDYRIAGSLYYTHIQYKEHKSDSIGLLRFSSFAGSLSSSNLSASLSRLKACKALIIDIRNNSGGNITTSDLFASHFMGAPRVVGSIRHKIGPGHSDFSEPTPIRLDPIEGLRWLRPVVVLTNRGVYSAANDFVLKMKGLPLVTIMGDITGGGGGLPMSSELPNGWGVRYSSTQTLDFDGNHIEHGIAPDYFVSLKPEDVARGEDTLIESAIRYINERYSEYKRTKIWRK